MKYKLFTKAYGSNNECIPITIHNINIMPVSQHIAEMDVIFEMEHWDFHTLGQLKCPYWLTSLKNAFITKGFSKKAVENISLNIAGFGINFVRVFVNRNFMFEWTEQTGEVLYFPEEK